MIEVFQKLAKYQTIGDAKKEISNRLKNYAKAGDTFLVYCDGEIVFKITCVEPPKQGGKKLN